jgi:hypothetical protein
MELRKRSKTLAVSLWIVGILFLAGASFQADPGRIALSACALIALSMASAAFYYQGSFPLLDIRPGCFVILALAKNRDSSRVLVMIERTIKSEREELGREEMYAFSWEAFPQPIDFAQVGWRTHNLVATDTGLGVKLEIFTRGKR